MRIIPAVMVTLVLATSMVPATGQDFLGPLEDFVEGLTDPPAQRPKPRQAPETVARPVAETPPPVPRPRPPSLPNGPVVEPPVAPVADEAVKAEPEQPAEEQPAEVEPVATEPAEPEPVAEPEPDRVYQVACPAVLLGLVEAEMVPPLSEGACGEQSPLVVTGVMSRGRMVPLSSPITTNCQMASALPGWVADVDGYAEAMLESPLAEISTGTSYMCRNRNNASSGFTSEHGYANAVDVTGFTLEDGRSIGVEADWSKALAPEGRLLRLAHDAACGGFTTVLGPEANAEHHDHLHLDLGCHGASCTAQICE
ncbi:MAG: extensin family protein [Devosia sp.]